MPAKTAREIGSGNRPIASETPFLIRRRRRSPANGASTAPVSRSACERAFTATALFVGILFAFAIAADATASTRTFHAYSKGQEIAQFHLKTPSGPKLTVKDFGARLVILNVWSEDCPVSIRELPLLDELQARFEKSDVVIVPTAIGGTNSVGRGELTDRLVPRNVELFVLTDLRFPRLTLALTGFPATLFLNGEGQEIGRVVGAVDWLAEQSIRLVARYADAAEKTGSLTDDFTFESLPALPAEQRVSAGKGCIYP